MATRYTVESMRSMCCWTRNQGKKAAGVFQCDFHPRLTIGRSSNGYSRWATRSETEPVRIRPNQDGGNEPTP